MITIFALKGSIPDYNLQVEDDYAILLARLGGGKGVVSKHYILQGIKALLSKYRVDRFFEEYKPSQDTIESMISASGAAV